MGSTISAVKEVRLTQKIWLMSLNWFQFLTGKTGTKPVPAENDAVGRLSSTSSTTAATSKVNIVTSPPRLLARHPQFRNVYNDQFGSVDSGLGGDQVDNESHMVNEEAVMVEYNDNDIIEERQLVKIITLDDVSRHQT